MSRKRAHGGSAGVRRGFELDYVRDWVFLAALRDYKEAHEAEDAQFRTAFKHLEADVLGRLHEYRQHVQERLALKEKLRDVRREARETREKTLELKRAHLNNVHDLNALNTQLFFDMNEKVSLEKAHQHLSELSSWIAGESKRRALERTRIDDERPVKRPRGGRKSKAVGAVQESASPLVDGRNPDDFDVVATKFAAFAEQVQAVQTLPNSMRNCSGALDHVRD